MGSGARALVERRANAPAGRAALAVVAALAIAAPLAVYPTFLMKALCFALYASAFNLLLGYAGLLSFGHAAFFGGAAYVTGHALKVWGVPPEVGVLLGTAGAALGGLVFGWIAIRRQGIYFAMITLALAQMVFFFAIQSPLTGGEDGIQAIPRGTFLGLLDLSQALVLYYVVLGVFALRTFVIYRAIHSPFGQVLRAIRDNEPRAVSLGYNTDRVKLLAFVLSAALAGLAGSTKVLVFQFATLTDVHWTMSGEAVLMTLIGGVGAIAGPIVGAFVWVTIIQGAIFVVCVLAFRSGIVGEILKLRAWKR